MEKVLRTKKKKIIMVERDGLPWLENEERRTKRKKLPNRRAREKVSIFWNVSEMEKDTIGVHIV